MQKVNNYRANIRLLKITLLVGIILLLIKFLAYYLTGSNAILGDALESIVNVVAGIIALVSLSIAAFPKDENHPYGHGKVEFISAGFEGGMIAVAGIIIIGKSIYNFFYPNELNELASGIALTAFSGAVNFLLGFILVKKGKKSSSAAMVASGEHLKTDTYTTIGLLAGLFLIWLTNIAWLDQVVAILFGFLILYSGYKIIRTSLSGILDETDLDLIKSIAALLQKNRRENWVDIHNLRVIKYGDALHIDCHVTLPWYLNLRDAHDEITRIDNLVNEHLPNNVELFIHEDPCITDSCKICIKKECAERKQPFTGATEWTLENVLRNKKHGVA
jgi:cation diffusion facilitator family transporter